MIHTHAKNNFKGQSFRRWRKLSDGRKGNAVDNINKKLCCRRRTARRAMSVNCRNKLYTSPRQVAVMEAEGYGWPTCSKQPRLVDCRIGVVNKLDRRRRRRVLLTTRSSCSGEIFYKSGVWDKVPEGNTLILKVAKFPYNTVWDRWEEAPCQNPSRLVQSFQYNTGL